MDEAIGFISLQVSDSLQFYLDGCNAPLAMWTNLEGLFGTMNEFRALQIEVELNSFAPYSFPFIEDFLMKFNQQRSLLQGYGKTKTDIECIYLILSKLRGNFQIYASTFYSTKDALGNIFTMSSFDVFFDHLNQEQDKLSHLDSLTGSQTYALVARPSLGMKEKTQKSHSIETQIDSSTYNSPGPPPPKEGKPRQKD